jgi:hypothetical protein
MVLGQSTPFERRSRVVGSALSLQKSRSSRGANGRFSRLRLMHKRKGRTGGTASFPSWTMLRRIISGRVLDGALGLISRALDVFAIHTFSPR